MSAPVLAPARRPLGPFRPPLAPTSGSTGTGPAPRPAAAPTAAARRELAPNATVVARFDLTPSIARFVIRPDGTVPDFQAGQYFAVGLEIDGRLVQRPYSTASQPGAPELEFLIRRVATGAFTPQLWLVGPGDRVWIGRPKGLFTLVPGDRRTHLFISTGTGLAPFISMAAGLIEGADTAEPPPWVVVLHGVSYAAELAYRNRLESWASTDRLAYRPSISRPADSSNAGWTGLTGRTEAVLDRVCDELGLEPDRTVAYICGNPDMIDAVAASLRRRGFDESAIVFERYWTGVPAVAR
jgi:ferredoxin--NADP+ reductase